MMLGDEATTFGGSAEMPIACNSSPRSSTFASSEDMPLLK